MYREVSASCVVPNIWSQPKVHCMRLTACVDDQLRHWLVFQIHMKSVIRRRFFLELAFDKKVFETFHEFRVCWKYGEVQTLSNPNFVAPLTIQSYVSRCYFVCYQVTYSTRIIDVLEMFISHDLSAVPVIHHETSQLVDIFCKSDVFVSSRTVCLCSDQFVDCEEFDWFVVVLTMPVNFYSFATLGMVPEQASHYPRKPGKLLEFFYPGTDGIEA